MFRSKQDQKFGINRKMVHFYLNCTKATEINFECGTESWKFIDFVYIFPLTRMIISIIGVVLNSIASFIFIFSKNMNTKFLCLLKHYNDQQSDDQFELFYCLYSVFHSTKYLRIMKDFINLIIGFFTYCISII